MSDNDVIVNADGPAEKYKMVPIAEWERMQAERDELKAELRAYAETEELTGKPGDGELHKRIRELETFLRSTFDDEDITPTSLEFWSSEYKHAMRQLADAGKKDQRIRDLAGGNQDADRWSGLPLCGRGETGAR